MIFPNIHFILYADDANIIITGSNITEVKAKVTELLNCLSDWVNINHLKLNVKKTHYMIFSNVGNYNLSLKLGDEPILQSHQERFLGVIMDDKLSWNAHRTAVAKKISRNAGIFFRARHYFKVPTLKTLYHSFIQSHLIFCSTVWGTGSKNSLTKIFTAQKKAIRAITFTKLYTKNKTTLRYSYGHTKNLFNSLEILTVHNLILAQLLSQMHKIYLHRAPTHIQTLFISRDPPTQSPIIHPDANNDTVIKIQKLGLDTHAIIKMHQSNISLTYFSPQTPRLTSQKHSMIHLGPLTYNHFCNKLQQNLTHTFNYNYYVYRLTPKCFNSHIKKLILSEQTLGTPDTWETLNMPLYMIPITTPTFVLRSQC